MNAPLPGPLADNPMLDRWVSFPSPGKVTVNTGRVELGQGVLTAMAQIAADELDVAMARRIRGCAPQRQRCLSNAAAISARVGDGLRSSSALAPITMPDRQ